MTDTCKILIIGAGPTALGAAKRLDELGQSDWLLFERQAEAGGLAGSVVDEAGFTWDMGGHVIFSHYQYFDRVLRETIAQWVEHVREAWVYLGGQFIPYPFQNNIWRLPPDQLIDCMEGLIDARLNISTHAEKPGSFHDWIVSNYGNALSELFFLPYNFKVWAYQPKKLDIGWTGERVARVDLKKILRTLVLKQDDIGWGPNSTFSFPLHGGTGAIWRGLAEKLPPEKMNFSNGLVRLDIQNKKASFENGKVVSYSHLISTIPLRELLRLLVNQPQLTARADELVYSSTHIVGLGMDGQIPAELAGKCWLYFPEPEIPFYRATAFSHYSPYNVPKPGKQWSLMCEVSESPDKNVNSATVAKDVLKAAASIGFIDEKSCASLWHRRLEYGYPTPFLGRDKLLAELDKALLEKSIHSRGRFGGAKYEVSNQDHSFMQGVEAVDNILFGDEEITYTDPNRVNTQGKRPEPRRPAPGGM